MSSSSEHLTAHRQFEIDARQAFDDAETEAKMRKRALEEEAKLELSEKMGNTLADFQIWPLWSVEDGETANIHIYTLTMKVVFKP